MVDVKDFIESYEAERKDLSAQMELMQEALSERVLQMENVGWTTPSSVSMTEDDTGGPSIAFLQELSERIRPLAAEDALFRRGSQLRNSYIFGRGMSFTDADKPRHKLILEEPHNAAMIASVEAYEMANLSLFCDGVFMTFFNKKSKRFTLLPFKQVSGVITNPDDAMDIWYVQRSWSANGQEQRKWYPTTRIIGTVRSYITVGGDTVAVDKNSILFIKHANRQVGWTWGVPDALPALIWAYTYSGALKNNATLLHALSKFAWRMTSSSKAQVAATKTRMEEMGPGSVGATAFTTGDISGVGVPSAQVNFNSSQPLAALVAASFGVPVIALIASPGAAGGSYGSAQTLDSPTLKGFEVVQNAWSGFFNEILTVAVGAEKGHVEFPAIDTDAPYRQISSIAQVVELGLIHRDEGRSAVLDILDIDKMHDELPEDPNQKEEVGSVVSSQGSPAAGAAQTQNAPTDHTLDADR